MIYNNAHNITKNKIHVVARKTLNLKISFNEMNVLLNLLNRFLKDEKPQTPSSCQILKLDDNVILNICSKLDIGDIVAFAQVNKRLSSITSHNLLWGVRFLKTFGPDYWGEIESSHPYKVIE